MGLASSPSSRLSPSRPRKRKCNSSSRCSSKESASSRPRREEESSARRLKEQQRSRDKKSSVMADQKVTLQCLQIVKRAKKKLTGKTEVAMTTNTKIPPKVILCEKFLFLPSPSVIRRRDSEADLKQKEQQEEGLLSSETSGKEEEASAGKKSKRKSQKDLSSGEAAEEEGAMPKPKRRNRSQKKPLHLGEGLTKEEGKKEEAAAAAEGQAPKPKRKRRLFREPLFFVEEEEKAREKNNTISTDNAAETLPDGATDSDAAEVDTATRPKDSSLLNMKLADALKPRAIQGQKGVGKRRHCRKPLLLPPKKHKLQGAPPASREDAVRSLTRIVLERMRFDAGEEAGEEDAEEGRSPTKAESQAVAVEREDVGENVEMMGSGGALLRRRRPVQPQNTVEHEEKSEKEDIELFDSGRPSDSNGSGAATRRVRRTGKPRRSLQLKFSALYGLGTQTAVREGDRRVREDDGAAGNSERVAIGPAMRVRVNVEGKVFLIPLLRHEADERRISWLAGETSRRYYVANGQWPQLTLHTKDGAVIVPNYKVTDLVTNNEEFVASVKTWEMPTLTERYAFACEAAMTPRDENITGELRMADSMHCLRLSHFDLQLHRARPLLRSLPGQCTLTVLDLSGNCLGDEGCKELGPALPSLVALLKLNLSVNKVTHYGLHMLVKGGSAGPPRLSALRSLELSANPLGYACARPLAAVLAHAPRLASLGLRGCDLTAAVFQDAALAGALAALESLRCIDAALNGLGMSSVRLLHGYVRWSGQGLR